MIFIDTSAMLKRYVQETGSDEVSRLMGDDPDWACSELARLEARVALCRRGVEGSLGSDIQRRFADDWDRFLSVPIDSACLASALGIGCDHRLRTLDAIHLAAALRLPRDVGFLSFDRHQAAIAQTIGLKILPTIG